MNWRRFLPMLRPSVEARSLEEFDLRRIAAEAGCDVLETYQFNADGHVVLALQLDCKTNENAIRFLNGAARRDAWDPAIVDFAVRLRRPLGVRASVADVASAIQEWVKGNIAFVREKDERFQHALITIVWRMGDCDDHARLVAALLFACGIEAQIVGVKQDGRLTHVCAQARETDGTWQWVETTLDAGYGEETIIAARRLGLLHDRPDIAPAA